MLVGNKVILEEIDPKNIEQLRQWRNNPELRQWFREYKDITKDKQVEWYNTRGNNKNPEHVYFQIMSIGTEDDPNIGQPYKRNIEQRIENRYLIGCCGLHYIDFRLRKAEFGIFIAKDRGEGKGKEALKLLFDYGFNELNLHKIWAEVYFGNEAINLYRKFLKEDGIIRDNSFHNGKYNNSTMMSVLEDEWKITKEKI
jgi:RimJ/RimL family protein N-acetyltransferase